MEELEDLLKKLMKKTSDPVRTCIHKVYIKKRPKTINRLIQLVIRCLEERRGGMKESDWFKYTSELKNVKEELEKENEELKDQLWEEEISPKKIPPKNNPPRLQ